MTVPAPTSPVQSDTQPRTVVRTLTVAVVVLAVLLTAAMGYIAATDVVPRINQHMAADIADDDAYRNWPPAGTEPAPPGQELPTAQGIVALTCRDGKAYLDENMLVGSTLREGVMPSWFLEFYVDYDQTRNKDACDVRYAPLHPGVQTTTLTLTEGGIWSQSFNAYSFDGLASFSARKESGSITVLLITFGDERVKPGIQIKYGSNGILAPARELLKS